MTVVFGNGGAGFTPAKNIERTGTAGIKPAPPMEPCAMNKLLSDIAQRCRMPGFNPAARRCRFGPTQNGRPILRGSALPST
jgi:hypothetical protein